MGLTDTNAFSIRLDALATNIGSEVDLPINFGLVSTPTSTPGTKRKFVALGASDFEGPSTPRSAGYVSFSSHLIVALVDVFVRSDVFLTGGNAVASGSGSFPLMGPLTGYEFTLHLYRSLLCLFCLF